MLFQLLHTLVVLINVKKYYYFSKDVEVKKYCMD